MGKISLEEKYMREAIRQAKKALVLGEVPIGCVIEYQGKIIARGYNRRMTDHSALAHAEIIAIKKACKKMGDWRLEGCTMYVTLEPCPMCAGAIVQARIPKVVIGSMNAKAGCAGSVLDLLHEDGFNHQAETQIGVLQEECSQMLSDFPGATGTQSRRKIVEIYNRVRYKRLTISAKVIVKKISNALLMIPAMRNNKRERNIMPVRPIR